MRGTSEAPYFILTKVHDVYKISIIKIIETI